MIFASESRRGGFGGLCPPKPAMAGEGGAYGNRTRVDGVKGRYLRPLDQRPKMLLFIFF